MRLFRILLAEGDGEAAFQRVLPIGAGTSACFRQAGVRVGGGRSVGVLGFGPTGQQLSVRSGFGSLRQRLRLVHAVLLG